MGWKNVKDHYEIRHMVCVKPEGICIGSGYIHDIIVISADGKVVKRYDSTSNADLHRYQAAMDADPALLRRLVTTADTFTQSIPVYTYDDGRVVEKRCEQLGWPNVTHDGDMMYENTFFAERSAAVAKARSDALLGIKFKQQSIEQKEGEISKAREYIRRLEANLAELATEELSSVDAPTPKA